MQHQIISLFYFTADLIYLPSTISSWSPKLSRDQTFFEKYEVKQVLNINKVLKQFSDILKCLIQKSLTLEVSNDF